MKQTAVEWLMEQLTKNYPLTKESAESIIEQAKEMEKEQSHAEYMRGWKDGLTKQETYESNTCLLNDGCDGIRCYNCINNRNL